MYSLQVIDHIYKSLFLFLFVFTSSSAAAAGGRCDQKCSMFVFYFYVQFFNGFLQLNKYICNGYLPDDVVYFCGVTGLLSQSNGSAFLFADDIHIFAQSDLIEIHGHFNPVDLEVCCA